MDKQAIIKTDLLEDRVRVYFHLKTPDGIPHFEGMKEVLYKDIPNLPKEPKIPEDRGHPQQQPREYWAESVFVKNIGKTITYHFTEWHETCRCREQDFAGGPYLSN